MADIVMNDESAGGAASLEAARRLLESLPMPAYTTDAEGSILRYNEAALSLWGREPEPGERFSGTALLFRGDGTLIPRDECWLALALREDVPFLRHRLVVGRPDGSRVPVVAYASPLHAADGRLEGAIGVFEPAPTDDTNGSDLFRAAFFASPAALAIAHLERPALLEANDAFARLFGWPREDLLGKDTVALGLWPSLDRFEAVRDHLRSYDALVDAPGVYRTRDGELRYCIDSWRVIRRGNDPLALVSVQDVTELRRAEARGELAEQRLALIAENAPCSIWAMDRGERVTFAAGLLWKALGLESARVIGTPLSWLRQHSPELARRIERAMAGEVVQEYIEVQGRHLSAHVEPQRGPGGDVLGVVGIAVDITESRVAERMVAQAQRLESLGMLAAGVAHDFNNHLAAIGMAVALAAEELPPDSPAAELLSQAKTAAEHAAGLARQLMLYAGRGERKTEHVDLSLLISEMAPLLRVVAGRSRAVRVNLDVAPPLHRADATQLRQLIMNLVINAAEALGERGGAITVGVSGSEAAPDLGPGTVIGSASEGPHAIISISDDGPGIGPDILPHIFDPFFTTKPNGHGLGLASVLGIVRSHQGGLQVESRAGGGTTFRVALPAEAAAAII